MVVQMRIADYMKSHGIMQQFLVKKTGIRQARLSYILNGQSELKADECEKILKALEIDPNYVFDVNRRRGNETEKTGEVCESVS